MPSFPDWFYPILSFLLGGIVGSFLNVCIWRLPREESLALPGSHCPGCGAPVAWYDNIPILSWLVLRGRCRACKGAIPFRYWVVEALTACLFAYMSWRTRSDPVVHDAGVLIPHLLLVCGLIVATFVDFDHRIIPDEISKTGMVAGPLLSMLYPPLQERWAEWRVWEWGTRSPAEGTVEALVASLLGMATGAGMIFLLGWLGEKAFKKEAMGFGDVKLMGMVGAFLGWQTAFLVFWIAPILALGPGLVQRFRTGDRYMPYGPFLSLATLLTLLWRAEILALAAGYSALFGT